MFDTSALVSFAHTANDLGKEWWGLLLIVVVVGKSLAHVFSSLRVAERRRIERAHHSRNRKATMQGTSQTELKTSDAAGTQRTSRSSLGIGEVHRRFERPLCVDHVL
jgi:hypothetical protein